jgi:IclR family acetate operon transcriptional repressor
MVYNCIEIIFHFHNLTMFGSGDIPMQTRSRGRPKSAFTEPTTSTMQALDRALAVLTHLAQSEGATLSDISAALAIPAPTTHRILTTLQGRGYAAMNEASQTWSVGIEAYRTGASYLKRTNLLDVSRPVMRRLMEMTGETAKYGNIILKKGVTPVK